MLVINVTMRESMDLVIIIDVKLRVHIYGLREPNTLLPLCLMLQYQGSQFRLQSLGF